MPSFATIDVNTNILLFAKITNPNAEMRRKIKTEGKKMKSHFYYFKKYDYEMTPFFLGLI